MSGNSAKWSRKWVVFMLGLAAVCLVAVIHFFGFDERLELQAVDFRFRHFPRGAPRQQITRIVIDDNSLEQLGRWPWPRRQLGGIIDVLHRCGAESIALDIILPDPQDKRYVSDEMDIYSPTMQPLLGDAPPQPVFDDAELTEAITRDGQVILAMHVESLGRKGSDLTEAQKRLRRLVRDNPKISFESVTGKIDGAGNTKSHAKAYLRYRAVEELKKFSITPRSMEGLWFPSSAMIPPLVTFAAACDGCGFVTFSPDVDGVMRRIELFARAEEKLWPHLSLTLAAECLAAEHGGEYEIGADADSHDIILRFDDGFTRRIPTTHRGGMLVNWSKPSTSAAGRVPITAPGVIWRNRQKIQRNHRRARLLQVELARVLKQSDLLKLFARADEIYQKRTAAQARRYRAMLYRPDEVEQISRRLSDIRSNEAKIENRIDKAVSEVANNLDFYLQGADDNDASVRRIRSIEAQLAEIKSRNAEILRQCRADEQKLRERLDGKICIIGSTATGAADFVPTPAAERMPGVEVNSQIAGSIITGQFIRRAGLGWDMLAIILLGVATAVIATWSPTVWAAPVALVLAAAYAVFDAAIVFGRWGILLTLSAPILVAIVVLVVVTAGRLLLEERAKRRIRGMFAHALSPVLVDRLIESPQLAQLGGQRRVLTCFFSDLAGFTNLAERLGEQDTVKVLNRYFDSMTEIIQDTCGGYLNKFLGDGILALFGAPVPQDDHAARAIRAAVACRTELAQVNRSLARETGGPVNLSCRIGLASGEAMVGNCGSTGRMDYTAIGDCVNLASRLESANKYFGTGILITGHTYAAAVDEAPARPLGLVKVVGKDEPVRLWSVIAQDEVGEGESTKLADEFTRGVEMYQQGDFAGAAEVFEHLHKKYPHDKPSCIYFDLCKKFTRQPPAPDEPLIIELTEK